MMDIEDGYVKDWIPSLAPGSLFCTWSCRITIMLRSSAGTARARIEGQLRMKHTCYYKDYDRMVDAPVVGYLEWEPASRRIRSLRLVTDGAVYRGGGAGSPFGVAVRSMP